MDIATGTSKLVDLSELKNITGAADGIETSLVHIGLDAVPSAHAALVTND